MAWEEARVVALVKSAVTRKLHLFIHFPDLGFEDLVQEGLMAARKAWPRFNPSIASWSTYLTTAASRRLLQIVRDRSRAARRDGAVAIEADGAARAEEPPEEIGEGEPLALSVWVRNVYVAAKGRFGAASKREGRKFFSPAQATTAVVLMAKLALTPASAVLLFNSRPELRESIRFRHTPSESWFRRAWEFCRRYRDLDALRAKWEAMNGMKDAVSKPNQCKPIERKPMIKAMRSTPAAVADEQLLGAINRLVNSSGYSKALARVSRARRELSDAQIALKAQANKLRPIHRELLKLSVPAGPPARKAVKAAKPANNKPEASHAATPPAQKTSAA